MVSFEGVLPPGSLSPLSSITPKTRLLLPGTVVDDQSQVMGIPGKSERSTAGSKARLSTIVTSSLMLGRRQSVAPAQARPWQ